MALSLTAPSPRTLARVHLVMAAVWALLLIPTVIWSAWRAAKPIRRGGGHDRDGAWLSAELIAHAQRLRPTEPPGRPSG